MPNTTISFEFPEYKLKAIEQALREKGEQKSVPELLAGHVDGLYVKNVPAPARKYLDSMLGEVQDAAPEQEPDTPSRRPYRRREIAARGQESEPSVMTDQLGQEQPESEQTLSM